MATPLYIPGEHGREVGSVRTTITVTNDRDRVLSAEGYLALDDVRSVTIHEAMVDTGASVLCLPQDIVDRLGLPFLSSTQIHTAVGERSANRYSRVWLTVQGRSGLFDCIALPTGTPTLLGCVPMEVLGLRPDLVNRRLELLPDEPGDTYVFVY